MLQSWIKLSLNVDFVLKSKGAIFPIIELYSHYEGKSHNSAPHQERLCVTIIEGAAETDSFSYSSAQ